MGANRVIVAPQLTGKRDSDAVRDSYGFRRAPAARLLASEPKAAALTKRASFESDKTVG